MENSGFTQLKKQRLIKALLIILSIILMVIGYSGWSIYTYNSNSNILHADAAIVLGAAAWGDQPSPVFRERINHGIELYKRRVVQMLIFTGGQGDSNEPAEAIVAKYYALKQGVSEADILTETQSRTTQQNLYYSNQIAVAHHLTQFLIVSDPLHMKRAMLIARDMGMDAYASPTPTTRYQSLSSKLGFLARETYFYFVYLLQRSFAS
jgi:uncharacterized SAM-binding protein YcdF (DUF218 family)